MTQDNCRMAGIAVHHVGNSTQGESLLLSETTLQLEEERLEKLLMQYFLGAFGAVEYYEFGFSNGDLTLNPLYRFAQALFADPDSLLENSRHIARQLYEVSAHPQIKSGDLFVVYFTGMELEGESMDAIGIFKAEHQQAFLQPGWQQNQVVVQYAEGINTEQLDKGCLIFNTDTATGYKVCVVDKANRQEEARFWKDQFLMLQPCGDAFHHTKALMTMTRQYVTQQYAEEFDVSKTDQIDLLNRSLDYFKTHPSFDKATFEQEVFHHPEMIQSFQQFNEAYCSRHELSLDDQFDISRQAVKNQARIFRHVLKLDKNFHIYIHGNKNMIERGVEEDGRKYYKIYYENEQ
jgi:37-kD nucleoid-associated bacterial protein